MPRMTLVLALAALPLATMASTAAAKRSYESLPPAAMENSQRADPGLVIKVAAAAESRGKGNAGGGKPDDNGNGGNAGGNGKANGCDRGNGRAIGCNDSPG